MPYYTKEQILRAKGIDLLTYLRKNEPEELVYETKNTYTTKTHDSLKINNGMWYWFSRSIGAKSALDYLIIVKGFTFTEAVGHLINQKGIEKKSNSKNNLTKQEKIDRLVLPKRATNNRKIIYYLIKRGISKNIINQCISNNLIYQDLVGNVVFVGYDELRNPRYAHVRGTNKSRYMHDVYGSDKAYSFNLKSIKKNNSVHLFESAIDLLSYATLKELNNEMWDEENLLSLAGVFNCSKKNMKVPKALTHYLKCNPCITTLILHLDNDNVGRISTETIKTFFSDSYKIIDSPSKCGKDYNDYLCNQLKNNLKQFKENYR